MTDLTPETLTEWRKDAKNGALLSGVGKDRRIAVLIDALAAEKAAREEATKRYVAAEHERMEEKARADKAVAALRRAEVFAAASRQIQEMSAHERALAELNFQRAEDEASAITGKME